MQSLNQYKVELSPTTTYYIPNFITHDEEQEILKKVYEVPKPKWTYLKNRRLQDYGGIPHRNGMIVDKIPSWLDVYLDRVSKLNVFNGQRANHVLINEYLPGQGIMPHLDGSLFYPTITTITCGSHGILEFLDDYYGSRIPICSLLLERYSLVILQGEMYGKYLHCINEVEEDVITEEVVNLKKCGEIFSVGQKLKRETRVSLTIRNVPKVAKLDLMNIIMNKTK
nr:alpha-ketoglutarate-dependent dioxygenase alkB homolog 6 [Onthophagus taurus]